MSSQALKAKPLVVTKENTPRTHNIYMQYPIEVTECWANITAGKDIADGVDQHERHCPLLEYHEDTYQAAGQRLAQLHGRRDPQKRRCARSGVCDGAE